MERKQASTIKQVLAALATTVLEPPLQPPTTSLQPIQLERCTTSISATMAAPKPSSADLTSWWTKEPSRTLEPASIFKLGPVPHTLVRANSDGRLTGWHLPPAAVQSASTSPFSRAMATMPIQEMLGIRQVQPSPNSSHRTPHLWPLM